MDAWQGQGWLVTLDNARRRSFALAIVSCEQVLTNAPLDKIIMRAHFYSLLLSPCTFETFVSCALLFWSSTRFSTDFFKPRHIAKLCSLYFNKYIRNIDNHVSNFALSRHDSLRIGKEKKDKEDCLHSEQLPIVPIFKIRTTTPSLVSLSRDVSIHHQPAREYQSRDPPPPPLESSRKMEGSVFETVHFVVVFTLHRRRLVLETWHGV